MYTYVDLFTQVVTDVYSLPRQSQPTSVAASPLCEVPPSPGPLSASVITEPPQLPPLLTPGEVIRGSGKYPKPTKIQGKYKDEVVIRNCDSGKGAPWEGANGEGGERRVVKGYAI